MKSRKFQFFNYLFICYSILIFSDCSILGLTIGGSRASRDFKHIEKFIEGDLLFEKVANDPDYLKYSVSLLMKDSTKLLGKFKGAELEVAGLDTFKYVIISDQKINVDNVLYFKITKPRTASVASGFFIGIVADVAIATIIVLLTLSGTF